MIEKSVDEIFQKMFDKRIEIDLAPIKGVRRWISDILGHDEYERFWQEILDNNPGKVKDQE
jgi:hypothetical protein